MSQLINVKDYGPEKLRMTLRLISEQAMARGWQVWLYHPYSSHVRLIRPDNKAIELYGSAPDTISFPSAHMANDKFITNMKLTEAGLPVIQTELIRKSDEDLAFLQSSLSAGKKWVIKPLDSAHGNGVTTGICNIDQAKAAIERARQYSNIVLAQIYLQNTIDIRVACINYKMSAALIRQPARVMGDGFSTVRQLIEIENKTSRRGYNYAKELNYIDVVLVERFLQDGIEAVPAEGEWCQVVGTANVGTGGETIDITDLLPPFLVDMAESAAKALQLGVCGVDFLLAKPPLPTDTIETLNPVIVEINKAPALFIHETPTQGSSRPVTADLLNYLELV